MGRRDESVIRVSLRGQLQEARQQANRLMVEAEQEVDKLYREALALAQADANASREKARRDFEQQRDQALASLAVESDRLGTLIVDRLLAA